MSKTSHLLGMQQVIRNTAARLVGRCGFEQADIEDLEQELWVGYLAYQRRRSEHLQTTRQAALDDVVVQTVGAILRYRQSPIEPNSHESRWNTCIEEVGDPTDAFQRHLLQQDVQSLLDRLPDDLKALCRSLRCEHNSITTSDGNASSGERLAQLQRLRRIFRAAQLHHYLD